MLARIIGGLILAAIGGFMAIKSNLMLQAFGAIPWAEEHLGTEGGSRLFYILVGIGTSILGFLLMTNLLGELVLGIFGPLFGGFRGQPN